MAYNPNQPRVPAGNEAGGQWTGSNTPRSRNPILRELGVTGADGRLTPQTEKLWRARMRDLESRSMLSPSDFSRLIRLKKIFGED